MRKRVICMALSCILLFSLLATGAAAAGSESAEPDNKVMAEQNLHLGCVKYYYNHGGREAEFNPGVVGSISLSFLVYGPGNVQDITVLAPRAAEPSDEEANAIISDVLSGRTSYGSVLEKRLPFMSGAGTRPVTKEDIGNIRYLIVIGLDKNSEYVGYAVVRVRVTNEDRVLVDVAQMDDGFAPAAPIESDNSSDNNYRICTSPMTSYLYQDRGYLVRAEFHDGSLVVERYTPDYTYVSSKTVELYAQTRNIYVDAPSGFGQMLSTTDGSDFVWGGFYPAEDANYVVIGWDNMEENEQVEVMRTIKYDKDFNYLSEASVYGSNTTVPFYAASFRWAECGDTLFAHTGHRMYMAEDGLRHQANMTAKIQTRDSFALKEGVMTWRKIGTEAYSSTSIFGYVSHSFNQFILVDSQRNLVMLDQGDCYPRAAVLQRYWIDDDGALTFTNSAPFASGQTNSGLRGIFIQTFPGANGDNTTGASLGGLAETSAGYVTAYNYNGVGANSTGDVVGIATEDPNPTRNVYLSFTSKSNFTQAGTNVVRLTDYPDGGAYSAGTPMLVSTGMDGGYILWEMMGLTAGGDYAPSGAVAYARYDADGNAGTITMTRGRLSDCQPTLVNGKAVWYVTDSSAPVFYVLDESGLTVIPAGSGNEPEPGSEPAPAPGGIGVTVGGAPVQWTDAAPFIDENDRTMVPLRAVAEALGLSVDWDGEAREAVFTNGEKTLYFPIGSNVARTGDGGTVQMDTAAVIVNDRTYAPIRYLAEFFGFAVDWDGAARTVLIT